METSQEQPKNNNEEKLEKVEKPEVLGDILKEEWAKEE